MLMTEVRKIFFGNKRLLYTNQDNWVIQVNNYYYNKSMYMHELQLGRSRIYIQRCR